MKPRRLASIGAVLLYLWCEFIQGGAMPSRQAVKPTATHTPVGADGTAAESTTATKDLFGPARLAR